MEKTIQCPYCWQSFPIPIEEEDGALQEFVWDCEVCCKPIDVEVRFSGGNASVRAKKGDEL